jgi:hypothetical protein
MADRFCDPEHCRLLLADVQESWTDHVTPNFVEDRNEVERIAREDVTQGRISKRNLEEPLNSPPPFASPISAEGVQSPVTHAHCPPYVSLLDWVYTLVNATMLPGSRFKFCSENKAFPESLAQMLHMFERYTLITVHNHQQIEGQGIDISSYTENYFHGTSPHNLAGILRHGFAPQPQDTGAIDASAEAKDRPWGIYVGDDKTANRYPMNHEYGCLIAQDGSPEFSVTLHLKCRPYKTMWNVEEETRQPMAGLCSPRGCPHPQDLLQKLSHSSQ